MTRRDYDTMYDEYSGGTETHVAVDTRMKRTIENASTEGDREAYEEGFAAASGVRPESAESGGRIKAPEKKDDTRPDRTPDSIEAENPGLADV